jgi:hypothetical protein
MEAASSSKLTAALGLLVVVIGAVFAFRSGFYTRSICVVN